MATPNPLDTVCAKSMQDVIDYARANPGKFAFGNSGTWSVTDLMWRWFEIKGNVTFAGGGETIIALLGGDIQMAASRMGSSAP